LAAVGAAGTDVATFPPVAKGGVANGEGAGSIPGVEGAVGNALLLNGSGGSGSPEGKAEAVFAPGIVGGDNNPGAAGATAEALPDVCESAARAMAAES
jgi:hypothetical protein